MGTNPRDEIADAVLHGRLTPNEAEARLKELGLPPLASDPNPADFNPMGEVWWTLPMTIAWIAWRSSSDVTRAWEVYRREKSYWEEWTWRLPPDGEVHTGFVVKASPPASLSILEITEIYRTRRGTLPNGAITVKAAQQKLWHALAANVFQATGINTETGERQVISDHQWHDLESIEEEGRDVLRRRRRHGVSKHGYDDIAFRRQNIMAIWQPSRIEQRQVELPPPMSPHGPGYMPLYCAAQWIATRGGTFKFDTSYQPIWEQAYTELLARIASDDVAATATYEGKPVKLEGFMFAGNRSHSSKIDGDPLADDFVPRSLGHHMVCKACGHVGADVRPDWSQHTNPRALVGSVA